MKIKKPSVKGMKHTEYLGHFAKDKYMCEGHNTSAFAKFKEKYGMQWSNNYERDRAFAQVLAPKPHEGKTLEAERAENISYVPAGEPYTEESPQEAQRINERLALRKRLGSR